MARGARHETRWIATASPIVSIAPTSVTKVYAGRIAQKAGPKSKPIPGAPAAGTPTHAAAPTGPVSMRPKSDAAIQPATIPISGPQSRTGPVNRSITARVTPRVASTVTGPAAGAAPSGTLSMKSKRNGMTLTAISMITVPATVGVRTRRSSESRPARRNWNSDETITSDASSAGPPC